jgi:hypothetical protein
MCPTHNRYLAELDYGKDKMARYWRAARNRKERGRLVARESEAAEATGKEVRREASSVDADRADPPR